MICTRKSASSRMAQAPRHQEKRSRPDLHADVGPGRRRDAGLRAHRQRRTRSSSAVSPPRACRNGSSTPAPPQVITADGQMRGGKEIPLKPAVDEAFAMGGCEGVRNVIVYRRTGSNVPMQAPRDMWWDDVVKGQPETCEPTWVNAEHPLFILYTSGSTGKPKGVQHSTGGYLLWAVLTMKWTFDYKPRDVFWCTADVGWVTGHTYITYGPLAVGATEIMFEGVPTYPDAGRFWKMIQDHEVSVFYTAPTAIRSLIKANEGQPTTHPTKYDLSRTAHPRHGRRADQSGSVDVVPHQCRRRSVPDRRHLVADRNRRPSDFAAAGGHTDRARLVHAATARNHGRDRRRDRP